MRDVCLFAHFDQDDKVDDYVLRYLKKIKDLKFSIVFISTARLGQSDVERLGAYGCEVILRENTGLDFGSWSAGFAKCGSAIGGRLLLANDSVYGPIGSLAVALDRLTQKRADFYGLVESVEIAPHLQSWFLLFEPWVVKSAEFGEILAQPFSAMTRRQIIQNGEVGLSRRLMGMGFRYEALHRNDRGGLSRRHDANHMLVFWRELLLVEGIPFLKIELLRDNPIGGENATAILQAAEQIDPLICGLIRSHLARATPRPQRAALPRCRYAAIRKLYNCRRESRRVAGAFNLIKLEMLTVLVWTWRIVRRLLRLGQDTAGEV
jgi:lipopolysaccharide biosynthesis protein